MGSFDVYLSSRFVERSLDANRSNDDAFVVIADQDERGSGTRTLGDLLDVSKSKVRASEKDWVALVESVAARDQLALHSLYEQTHRIVFTLIVRITNNRETAEELTLDVFYDVWRRAPTYDPAGGPVIG